MAERMLGVDEAETAPFSTNPEKIKPAQKVTDSAFFWLFSLLELSWEH